MRTIARYNGDMTIRQVRLHNILYVYYVTAYIQNVIQSFHPATQVLPIYLIQIHRFVCQLAYTPLSDYVLAH